MEEYTDLFEMDSRLLVMEFERLTQLATKGEVDKRVSYCAHNLEEQIMFRLNQYDSERY